MKTEQKTAWLFPGQGIQEVGMGHKLYDRYPTAAYIYGLADGILGYQISKISFEGPLEELNKTINTQPAILTFGQVCYDILRNRRNGRGFHHPEFVAGNSLGEYNALIVAEALSFEDGLRLVKARAEGIQRACEINPGGLCAVRNPSEEAINRFKGLGLEIALINTSDQTVFGGLNASLDKAEDWAKQNQIRFTRLPVAGAFHTSLMEPAVEPFSKALEYVKIEDCRVPVIANTTAKPIRKAEEIRQELIDQLTKTVLWHETLVFLDQQGIHQTIEIGNKRILTNMVNRTIAGGVIGTITVAGGIIAAVLWRRHHR